MGEINKVENHIDNPEVKKENLEHLKKTEQRKQEIGSHLDTLRTNDSGHKAGILSETKKEVSENKQTTRVEKTEDKREKFASNLDKESVTKMEKEVHSSFSRENFRKEDSFDAKAKEQHPELNGLKSKCVYEVSPMGTPKEQIDRSPIGTYTEEERKQIKDIRETIDAPTTETKMQKVIGVDTGNAKEDLNRYLDPHTRSGKPCEAHVTGYVAKAEDTVPFTGTPKECYENLRLDYDPGTDENGKERKNPYQNPDQSVYVVRYTDGTNYDIPYSEEFGGNTKEAQPFTGNGFVSAKDVTIPEYTVRESDGKGAVVSDGEIYRVKADGTEELVAKYNKQDQCFELVTQEDGE